MKYGERLKAARHSAKLTQAGLANKTGNAVTQQNISLLEAGEASGSEFTVQLALACGVRPEWLALEQGPMVISAYTENDKLDHLFKIAQALPEYALDDAIKRVTDLAQLLQQASVSSIPDRRRTSSHVQTQGATSGRRKTDTRKS
jgi:transcriptional regulator with XRE-family HTH domain